MGKNNKSNEFSIKDYLLSTAFLFYSSWLIGSFIIIFGSVAVDHLHGQPSSDSYIIAVLLLGLPWIIFASIVVIVRKEVPRLGLRNIKGSWAIFQGVLGLVASGSAEIILLYNFFQEILRK